MNKILKSVQLHRVELPISHTPTIEHDCDTCVYLGNSMFGGQLWELYYHDGEYEATKTFIARYGKDEKYISGFHAITRHPMLALAFTRKIVGDYN